ncbi:50S ribosomal protein L24 [bacterium]|nr:MAG: 50S ribosomal protein L24 [bacterium]
MKIKKGDKIKVTAGKDKGRDGVVEKVYQNAKKVVVTGVNIYKKHVKKNEKMPQGGIVEIPRAMDVSKLVLVCPKCGKATRVGYKVEKNKKYRICKKCESKI